MEKPLIIGHRGASGDAPENTLAAFELALRQGADGVEFDVHLTRDGVPVVIHDARLGRTTSLRMDSRSRGNDARGGRWRARRSRIGKLSLAELRQHDAGSWFNRLHPSKARGRYAGLRIPTLAEALAWAVKRRTLAFVEIKNPLNRYRGLEENILREIREARAGDLVTVISFDARSLRRVRALDRGIALGLDFTNPMLSVSRARRLRAATLLPHWRIATERFLRRAHSKGFRVIAWALDDPREARRLLAAGVDGIMTNYPGRLAGLRRATP